MSAPAPILREIHRLKLFARDLQEQIDRGPRLLKGQNARVERQQELLHETQAELKRLKVKMHEDEVTHGATLQQITKHEKQQGEAASKKEYDAFKTEIDADRKKVQQLEDAILGALGKIEEDTAQLPELEKAIQQVKAEAAQYEKDYATQLASWSEQLRDTQKQLTEVEETLPVTVQDTYHRLMRHRGEDALALVASRTCTACHHEITAQNHNELRQGSFVICKSCGRMLYLSE